jgi:ribonucleoside-diphosphate reductase beta chain
MSCDKSNTYKSFCPTSNNALEQNMFFGESVAVSRYDVQKYPFFEKLIEKQLSFFWRPEEVDLNLDKSNFESLSTQEQHIFVSNLKYQTLLDSVQGRSPNVAFLPIVSVPELETWIETWAFSETIHSRTYTHIIRAIFNNPSEIFDSIVNDKEIVKRAIAVTEHYDELIFLTNQMYFSGINLNVDHEFRKKIKKALLLTIVSVNVLEAIRFYVSFACSFSFAERGIMDGNAKLIRLIARDEALHLSGTMHIIDLIRSGRDDPEMKEIYDKSIEEIVDIFLKANKQEKEWAAYLFKDGSIIGLNEEILSDYIDYITDSRMSAIGLNGYIKRKRKGNPLPWMDNHLKSDNVQVAPQEVELSSYLVGQVDSNVDSSDFDGMEL